MAKTKSDHETIIVIQKGTWKIECPKYDITDIEANADGLVFKFRDRSFFSVVDADMPIKTKEIIRSSFHNVGNASIQTITLDPKNYKSPVMSTI